MHHTKKKLVASIDALLKIELPAYLLSVNNQQH